MVDNTDGDEGLLLSQDDLYAHRLVEAVQDVFYIFDAEGQIVDYNDRLLEVTGYDRTEVATMDPWGFFPEDERDQIAEEVTRVLDGERVRTQGHFLTSDGETIPYEFTGSPLYERDEVVGFVGLARDISEQKRRERELTESKRRYKELTERISDAYYAFDSQWRVTYWNDTVAQRQGIPAEEILGKNLWEEYPELEGTVYGETLREAMETQEPQTCEFYYEPDDYWVKAKAYPDTNGIAVISRDITEQKEREQRLEETNEQLEVLNRVLRHDIRNDVEVILGWAELLEGDVPEEHERTVRELLSTAEHVRDLTENSRAFMQLATNGDTVDTHSRRLDEVLRAELEKVQSTHATATFHVEEPLPEVSVPGNELLPSVFRNLLNNAVEHAGEAPHVEVYVRSVDDRVRVFVADDGPGVPDDRKESIFGKGKQGLESKGTGIGLYLVDNLVESYGGDVWVEDREGQSPSGNRTKSGDRTEHGSAGDRPEADDGDPTGAVFVVELPTATVEEQ